MPMINTDITQYKFVHSSASADTFSVESIMGTDKVGMPYSFEIVLHSDNHNIALSDLVMKKASLYFHRSGEFYPYSGIISSFEYVDTTVDFSVYRAVLRPQLWKLTLTRQNRIFLKKTIPDIISEILDEAELESYYRIDLDNDYPEREYIVQYDESDFNFISRHMETSGIWYLFDESPCEENECKSAGEEQLVITDKASSFKTLPSNSTILFRSRTDMVQLVEQDVKESIHDLDLCRRMIPKTVMVKSHNYHTPEIDLSHVVQVENGDCGFIYEYGGTFENATEAQRSAEILSDRLSYAQLFIEGKSNCTGLRAGSTITIEEHPRSDCNGEYLITEVTHTLVNLKESETARSLPYNNSFTAVPADKKDLFQAEVSSIAGQVPGVISALIESNGSEYAYLDETGRYKLRMPFDRSETPNTQGTNYIRQAQAYSGSAIGVHLPSHEKTEMLIGHILRNPDRPVGLGTVPNADTVSPVINENQQQSIIRTDGDNKIIMDDTDGKKKFSMSTPYDQSFSAKGNKAVSIGGDRTITVEKNENGTVETDQEITISGDQTITVEGDHEVTVQSEHEQNIQGNQSVTIAGSRKLEVTATGTEKVGGNRDVEIGGDCGLSVKAINNVSVDGTCTYKSDANVGIDSTTLLTLQASGTISIEGSTINLQGMATVTIIVGGSSMIISPAGITVTAPKLKVSGKDVNCSASTANTLMAGVLKIN